jgi:uncharacterized Fe-S cluster-containing radical SAM superfamily protein
MSHVHRFARAIFTGALGEFFSLPLSALGHLKEAGINTWPAVMGDLFGTEGTRKLSERLEAMGIRTRIETEYLERYPFVTANLKLRGGSGKCIPDIHPGSIRKK